MCIKPLATVAAQQSITDATCEHLAYHRCPEDPAAMTALQHQSNPPTRAVNSLREVWTIAWPTVLTMTSYTFMQFMDKLMVAQVGPVQLTAQSNGGIWAFNALSFAMGVLTVINTYVSQNLGAGTPRNGTRYAWAGIWLSAILWIALMIPYALILPWLFAHLPNHSAELQKQETGYAQILLFGSIVLLCARAMNQY